MKKIIPITLSTIFVFTLTGCSLLNVLEKYANKDSSEESSESSSKDQSSSGSSKDTSSSEIDTSSYIDHSEFDYFSNPMLQNSEEYIRFWEPETKHNFQIEMSQEAADFINNYQYSHNDSTYHDYYVPCTLKYLDVSGETLTMEEVGIRQKGNMSRDHILKDGNFSLDTLGHFKLSFKQTFDGDEYDDIPELNHFKKVWDDSSARKTRKNRTLYGMEKIDIKWNRNHDETNSKQSYMLKTFRDMDVIAGNCTLSTVSLKIEGKEGITTTYEVLECIDEVFIQRHFNEQYAAGDLYKCAYQNAPANFSSSYKVGNQIGVEDNTKNYHPAYDLKTNKKKNTTHTNLLNLIKVMNDKTSSADVYKKKIASVMNMESFMMYEAIAYLCGNFDDLRNNANNYYLYFTSETNYAFIIPYDFDRGLGTGCEGRQDYMTSFSAESTKMQCSGNWQNINIYWRTVCTTTDKSSGYANVERVEEYRQMYQSNIEILLNERIISGKSFEEYVYSFPEAYRGNPNGSGEGNTTFNDYLTLKIQSIKGNNKNYNIEV